MYCLWFSERFVGNFIVSLPKKSITPSQRQIKHHKNKRAAGKVSFLSSFCYHEYRCFKITYSYTGWGRPSAALSQADRMNRQTGGDGEDRWRGWRTWWWWWWWWSKSVMQDGEVAVHWMSSSFSFHPPLSLLSWKGVKTKGGVWFRGSPTVTTLPFPSLNTKPLDYTYIYQTRAGFKSHSLWGTRIMNILSLRGGVRLAKEEVSTLEACKCQQFPVGA